MKIIAIGFFAVLLIGIRLNASSIAYTADAVFSDIYTVSSTTAALTHVSKVTFPPSNVLHTLTDFAADPVHNVLYALDEGSGNILNLNPQSGTCSVVTTLTDGGFVHGLAYDPIGDEFYVSSLSDGYLYRADPNTGQTTKIGFIGSFSNQQQPYVVGLEFDPSTHILYGSVSDAQDNGALVRIDTTTGHGTLIGNTKGMADLAFAPDSNTLYGIDNGKGVAAGSLYTVDLATGAATLVGHINNSSLLALAFLSVPEPSTFALLTLGGMIAFAARRR